MATRSHYHRMSISDIATAAMVALAIGSFVALIFSCNHPISPKTLSYGTELEECNRNATSCEESITCENEVRKRYKRALRDEDAGCK